MAERRPAGKRDGELADLREARRLREEAAADAVRRQQEVVARSQAALAEAEGRSLQARQTLQATRQALEEKIREAGAADEALQLSALKRECERIEELDLVRLHAEGQVQQAQAELAAEQETLALRMAEHRQRAAQTAALDELIDERRHRAAVLDEARTEDQAETPVAPARSARLHPKAARS